MQSILRNKPELKEKHIPYTISIVILALTSVVLLMLPVIVNFLNKFSYCESTSDIVYYIFRGLFGLSIAMGVTIFALKKDISAVAIPCFFGFITVMFPLYKSVATFTNAYAMAQQLSMNVGFGPYLIDIGENLIYTLLCVFTFICNRKIQIYTYYNAAFSYRFTCYNLHLRRQIHNI